MGSGFLIQMACAPSLPQLPQCRFQLRFHFRFLCPAFRRRIRQQDFIRVGVCNLGPNPATMIAVKIGQDLRGPDIEASLVPDSDKDAWIEQLDRVFAAAG